MGKGPFWREYAQHPFGRLKTAFIAQLLADEKILRKRPANPTSTLSNTRHTHSMTPETLRWVGVAAAMIAAAVVWTIVIVVALHVSQTVLNTLEMIVELAAISPG